MAKRPTARKKKAVKSVKEYTSFISWKEHYVEFRGKKDEFENVAQSPELLAERLANDAINRILSK